MNFEELLIEFKARGFEHLGARANNYLNRAYQIDICEGDDWPFLEDTIEGAAPLEIPDLRTIEYVIDTTQNTKPRPMRRARITDDWNADLAEPGIPTLYYVTKGEILNVFPVSATNEFLVSYWKAPEELSGTDEPLLPKRWHELIVEGAVARAYRNSDDWELSQAAKATFEDELQRMRESLLSSQHDAPDDFIVVEDPAALA